MTVLPVLDTDEAARLQALKAYGILDTPPDETLDRITRLAAAICEAPVATISLIDADRQFFKSRVGVENCIAPRAGSFCSHVVDQRQPLIVTDACEHPVFSESPYVTGDPYIRFYLGMPLVTPTRHVLGTLCVYDFKPRAKVPSGQITAVYDLARLVVDNLELRRVAVHDSLTNLLTKGAFNDAAALELDRARRGGQSPSCIVLDLDHFKAINDTYGHAAGDDVLRAVSDVVAQHVRPYDLTGRIGGEEFAIVLPACEIETAIQLAQRLRKAIEDAEIVSCGRRIQVTASFGVAKVDLAVDPSFDAAIARADIALYRSKSRGRNCISTDWPIQLCAS